jgi:hypothetical protein
LLSLCGGGLWMRFGSLTDAWRYAQGHRLLVEPSRLDVGEGAPGDSRESSFTVRNLSSAPVRLIGVTSSCECVATDVLPVTIAPRGRATLHVHVHLTGPAPRTVEQSLIYRTDHDQAGTLRVEVVGRVRDRAVLASRSAH